MKNSLILMLFFVAFCSCSINKSPEFSKVDDITFVNIVKDTIHLKANAYFNNPNSVGGKISSDQIKVFINDAEVAQISSKIFKIPANNNFVMPLKIEIPTKSVFQNSKKGILGGLLNALKNNTVKVQLKGNLNYKFLVFTKEFPIDTTEEITIKF